MRRTAPRTTDLLVAGMKSAKCRERVLRAIEAVPGVMEVDVNLYRASARVTHCEPCHATALLQAVASVGYSASCASAAARAGRSSALTSLREPPSRRPTP
jgi:Cu+-exporting ATPase